MTLAEARKLQNKIQQKVLTKFFIYIAFIMICTFLIIHFTDYFSRYKSFFCIVIIAIVFAVKKSKIYMFIQRKEFFGRIEYSNVKVEHVKQYASHQAGVKYGAIDVSVLDLIVVNENGKKLRKEFTYDWRWGDYIVGHQVYILRFVDRPIVHR